jgi:hypothetical protein
MKERVSADFFVVLAPDGSGGAKVEGVKFVRGEEKLRAMGATLERAKYGMAFPDATQTRVVRRGILSCSSETGECSFVLMTADSVTSVD